MCLKCTPSVALDVTRPQTVLTHIGAHILYDSTVDRSTQPCGFCCRPFAICHFALKKTADGMTVKMDASKGCTNFVKKFNYGVAAKSTTSSPCSNVPLRCPECDTTDPSIWRYNLKKHLLHDHPHTPISKHAHLWELTESESMAMRAVWEKLQVPRKKKGTKKSKATLKISAAHSSRLALIDEQDELESEDDSFINDSTIPTPDQSDEDDVLEQLSDAEDLDHAHATPFVELRPPSPLEYIPGSDLPHNPAVEGEEPANSQLDLGDSHVLTDGDTGIPAEQTIVTRHPRTAQDIHSPSLTPLTLSANPAHPPSPDRHTRRSVRKRKEPEGLQGLAAALEACICGMSAAPEDQSDHPNLARCKNEGCETKWYHLRCLERGGVPDAWVCDACLSAGAGRSKRRRVFK
ncbi:hypothetical protein K438DRAFT_1677498 [Mycena galopus ATCC 62051]|nr:hypothetical protein K438DRAFT_1677498 [Mycena galopus ATCC 62051]